MSLDDKKESSLILSESSNLVKLGSTLSITNKLLFGEISQLFNKGFCLMNSKDSLDEKEDYLLLFENNFNLRKTSRFNFNANQDEDYIEAITLFKKVLEIYFIKIDVHLLNMTIFTLDT